MKRLRIIVAGEFWFGASGSGLAEGLRRLGHHVTEVNISDHFIAGGGLVSRALSRIFTSRSIRSYRNAILAAARRESAEVLLTVKGSFLSSEFLTKLRADGVFRVNYYPDFTFDHTGFLPDWLLDYDIVATTKIFQLPWLAERMPPHRFAHVHHGYSTLVHRPRGEVDHDRDFDWDIAYIGNASPFKRAWLAAVLRANPDRTILIAGNGWHDLAEARQHQNCVVLPPLIGDFYSRAVERSRVNLSIHFGPAGPQGWEDKVSTRTFEIPACRGFMLHIDNDEVRTLFEPGKEIDVFNGEAELNEKIAWYLDHDDERIAIAEAGYRRCVPAYSYDARAAEIMALVEARLSV